MQFLIVPPSIYTAPPWESLFPFRRLNPSSVALVWVISNNLPEPPGMRKMVVAGNPLALLMVVP